jgi:hypothetical protein
MVNPRVPRILFSESISRESAELKDFELAPVNACVEREYESCY